MLMEWSKVLLFSFMSNTFFEALYRGVMGFMGIAHHAHSFINELKILWA